MGLTGLQMAEGARGAHATAHAPAHGGDGPIVILHVIVAVGIGGAETALLRMIQSSDPALLKHVVVSLKSHRDLMLDAFAAAGAEVIFLDLKPSKPSISETRRFIETVRRCRPDIIQGWMVHGNLFAWIGRMFGARQAKLAWNLATIALPPEYEKFRTRLLTRAAAPLSHSVDVIISNSHAGLRDHRLMGYRARTEVVIPNGFDPELFRPDEAARREIRSALGLDESIVFGIVGRVHQQKGYPIFIEAARRVAAKIDNARFVLIGRGTDDPTGEIASLIDKAGIGDRTICLGERHDVEKLLTALDVLCLSSHYEGSPNVIGEGMATALPCIATAVADTPMVLGDTGIIVQPGDAAVFYEAMVRLASMPSAARAEMGRRARNRVLENFTLAENADMYTRTYVSIAGKVRRASNSR
jgi:glycosyltransferase involved in cell wall biosynthesis